MAASSAAWRRLRACPDCDRLVALPPLRPGERAECPRCACVLVRRSRLAVQRSLAYAIAALTTLSLALVLPFVGFEFRGVAQAMVLTDTGSALVRFGAPAVGAVVLLGVVLLPLAYLVLFTVLHGRLLAGRQQAIDRFFARGVAMIEPWMMADVFLVGALVSLTKVAGMATVEFGPAFWAYGAFVVLLVKTRTTLDKDWLWYCLAGEPRIDRPVRVGADARPQGLTGCHGCALVNVVDDGGTGRCQRCGERLHASTPSSIQHTLALLIVAVVLYIPANALPITYTTRFGAETASTIIGGVIGFVRSGDIPIAVIIFTASVVVPIAKMLALAWLCWYAVRGAPRAGRTGTRLHRVVDFIGRWSMVDVFVVAVLVALIQADSVMSITPGPAALAFAGMVIVSMMAAMTFDTRLLWQHTDSG